MQTCNHLLHILTHLDFDNAKMLIINQFIWVCDEIHKLFVSVACGIEFISGSNRMIRHLEIKLVIICDYMENI